MVDWASLGNLAKEVLFGMPMGVNFGGGRAPQWTIASAIKPFTDQRRREEGLTQLKTMGLLPDDVDTSQLSKMDEGLLGTALQLISKRGQETKLGDVEGATEAFFGIKPPQPAKEYGVMAPEVGEDPTLTQIPPSMEDQARYQQVAGITMPRTQIYKKLGEMQGQKASAATLRKLYPEYADQVSDQLSVPELVTLRQGFAKQKADTQKEAKEQAVADAAAKQYGFPPGLPMPLIKEELARQQQERIQNFQMDKLIKSNELIAGRTGHQIGQSLKHFTDRLMEQDKLRREGEDRAEARKRDDQYVRDINTDIRSKETLIQKYRETDPRFMAPEALADLQAMELELRGLKQLKGQVTNKRMEKSPLLSSTGKGGAAEFEDLFK